MKFRRWLSALLAAITVFCAIPAAMGEELAVDEVSVIDEDPVIAMAEEPVEEETEEVIIDEILEPEVAEEEITLGEKESETGETEAPKYADFLMEGEADDGEEYAVLAPAAGIAIDATNFPDANFRQYVEDEIDLDGDGYLSEEERNECEEIYVDSFEIASMKGVELFTNLLCLDCSWNKLTELDISKNTKLEELNCCDNRIKTLKLNANLETLLCDNNALTALDVSKCTRLVVLWCKYNNLTTLNISKNTKLEGIGCYGNKLTSLDITNCPNLVDAHKNTPEVLDDDSSETEYYFMMWMGDNGAIYLDKSTAIIANGKPGSQPQPTSVSLSQSSVTLGAGEKLKLNPTFTPNNAATTLTYKTTKKKVAVVAADGTITAKKKGTAYITVTTANGKKATMKVVVKKAPSKVTISPKRLILNVGLTSQLKAALPKKTAGKVTFSSSNPKVATVDASSGKVTAVAAGAVTITAKTYNNKTSTCTMTVLTGTAPTALTLNMTAVTLGKGQTVKIVPKLNSGANTIYTYSSSKKKYATVSADGTITGKKKGKAVITVKTHNGIAKKITVRVYNAPKKVTLSAKTLILNAGVSGALKAKLPKGTYSPITLTSDKPAVATVDSAGNVKAVAAGTATITARTYNNKTAICKVTVLTGKAPTAVTLAEPTITLARRGTYKITPKLNSGENTIYVYSTSNKKIATVSADGTVTAKTKKGKAVITVRTHNGKIAKLTVVVK